MITTDYTRRFIFNIDCLSVLARLSLGLALLMSFSLSAIAQSAAAHPERGIAPANSYAVSDIESVSLTNGNLNLSIPLAALPPMSGGKLSWALRAIYNSKPWDTVRSEIQPDPMDPYKYTVSHLQLSGVSGWRVGARYEISFQDSDWDYEWIRPTDTNDPEYDLLTENRWTKVVLSTPDGAEHELRPTDYSPYIDFYSNRPYLRGYYKDNPSSESINASMRYYSYDGSRLWVKIDTDPYLFAGNARSWTLYLPDGTKVEQLTSGIQRVTDTNGNKIKIWSETDGNGVTTTHYQDELASREIKYVYDPAGNGGLGLGQAQYQIVGGDWVTIDINFGTTQVQGKVYWINDAQCSDAAEVVNQEIVVIRSIILPLTETGLSRKQFTFTYNADTTVSISQQWRPDCSGGYQTVTTASPGWGSLSRMVTPLGAIVDYSYGFDGDHLYTDPDDPPRESLTLKELKRIESSVEVTLGEWEYEIGPTSGSVTGPDGSTVTETKYPHDPAFLHSYSGFGGKEGLVYRIDNSEKVRIERHWTLMMFSGGENVAPGAGTYVTFNPVVDAEYTTLLEGEEPIKMSAKTFQYDYNGNLLEEKSYDWFDPSLVSRDAQDVPTGVPGAAVLLRTTTNSFYNQATASNSTNVYAKRSLSTFAPLILNAPEETVTGPSQIRFSYDGENYGTAPSVGNLTQVSVWDDQASAWRSVTHDYNGSGNRTSTTDPNNNQTLFYYDTAPYVSPTRIVVDPQNGTGTQTTTFVYDSATELVTSQTDPNSQTTTISYANHRLSAVDPYGRPGWVIGPDVTSVVGGTTYTNQNHKVKTTYFDQDRQVVVESDLNQEGDGKLKARTTSDELGRVIKIERNEDGTSAWTISSQNLFVEMGRITMSSNPKRSAAASTDGWTRITRDLLGRVTEAATFLGTSQPPDTGTSSSAWTGSVTTSYYANQTTVTDQAGKQRRSVTDGLGRLAQAIEDPNGLNYQTNYTYDSLGNLRRVEQGSQNRYFMYDSLSRLIRARNPEQDVNSNLNLSDPITSNSSWSMKYTYQANGNLATRVDARNITTTYSYDGLNRNTSVDYSDSTPDITRVYDTATLGKGRLQKTETAGAGGVRVTINSYDAMGRPLSQSQQFYVSSAWGSSYTVQHTYDLAGNVTSQTYPSGHTTATTYNAAGQLNNFSGNLGAGGSALNYVTGTTVYTAAGQMTEEKFDMDNNDLYHRRHFNSRGQMYDVRLGTGSTDDFSNATWNRGAIRTFYSSNLVDYNTPPTGQQNNNGNVYRQDHFVPLDTSVNDWVMSVDSYSYDALNRLTGVSEAADSYISSVFQETYPYAQYFNYDRYGNRTLSFATTGAVSGAGATTIKDTVWVEDALPTGATGYGDGGDGWTWISSNPAPVSGSLAHQSNIASGMHQHYFTGATATMAVASGDKLFAYVYLDPANMPSEVMLQWNDGTGWEHRAYWGTDSIAWGTNGTASRRHMGSLPPSGGWMRLEVSASLVGLEGQTVSGMAFTLYDGRATWDRAGKSAHPGGSINNLPFNVDEARNRLLPMSGALEYDAAGNLSKDNYTTPWLGTRNYDAENRMVKTHDDQEDPHSIYHYDGDGKRARRIINSVETWQIYGIGGELLAEYAAEGATNAPQKEYGYRGGQLLIVAESNGTVKWLVTDQLGTPRMVVDKSGDLSGANGIVRHDYLPFGEEIGAGVGIRNSSSGYGTDTVRQKFTGQERDDETGLDYFLARYYSPTQGRFTSADPIVMESRRLGDPQGINLYAYTRNNPLKYIDPDGEKYKGIDDLEVVIEREKVNGKKIWVIKSNNASEDLQRLVNLINKSGSKTASDLFAKLNKAATMVNIVIDSTTSMTKEEVQDGVATIGLHQPHDKSGPLNFNDETNKFDGIADPAVDQKGRVIPGVYREATITLFELKMIELKNTGQMLDDQLVSTFGHEVRHDTDPIQIQAGLTGGGSDAIWHPVKNGKPAKKSPNWYGNKILDEINASRRKAP